MRQLVEIVARIVDGTYVFGYQWVLHDSFFYTVIYVMKALQPANVPRCSFLVDSISGHSAT